MAPDLRSIYNIVKLNWVGIGTFGMTENSGSDSVVNLVVNLTKLLYLLVSLKETEVVLFKGE